MAILCPGCKQTLTSGDLSTTGYRFLELFTYTPAEPGTPLDQRRRGSSGRPSCSTPSRSPTPGRSGPRCSRRAR
jgi:hypothetical protein